MTRSFHLFCAAVLALLCSSAGLAATVTLTPSNSSPGIGDTFSVTVSGADFPETAGASLVLNFNSAVVSVNTPTLTNGIVLAAGSPFTGGVIANDPTLAGDQFTFLAGTPPAALPAGSFDAIVIHFTAIGAGLANIVLFDDGIDNVWTDGNTFAPIPVTYIQANVTVGTGSTPNIAVTDSVAPAGDQLIPFGDVAVSADATVTVTNSGTADLVLGTLAAVDALAAPFSLANDLCSGQTLTPTSSCTVDVLFSPAATGAFNDAFDIPSNDADQPAVTVSVSGAGTSNPVPNVAVTDSVAPASDLLVPFGNITQAQTGTQTVTVTNSGNADLVLGPVATADPLAAPFSVGSDSCSNQTLTALASCTFQVLFQPLADGAVNDTLDIPSNDPDTATLTVNVNGAGTPVAAPNVVVTDSVAPETDLLLPFGSITVGGLSTQTVTVTNSGDTALLLGPVAMANPLAAPFSVATDNCSNQTVVALGSCTFQVQFQPTAAGAFNDALDIPSNDADTPTVSLSVSGSGTESMAPAISVSDTVDPTDDLQVGFGDEYVYATTEQTVTVTNDGAGDLVLGTVGASNPLAAPFSVAGLADTCSGQTLAPAATCTFRLEFNPDAAGIYNDSFDIPSNDPDTPAVTLAVSGTGITIPTAGSSAVDPWSLAVLAGLPLLRRRRRL